MKNLSQKIQYDGKEYTLLFDLIAMEEIQNEYGDINKWVDLTDGEAYARKEFEEKYDSLDLKEFYKGKRIPKTRPDWSELSEEQQAQFDHMPDISALIFGYTCMINEGIDLENEEKGTNRPFLTKRQVGRLLTGIGLKDAARTMNKLFVESTKGEEKNE